MNIFRPIALALAASVAFGSAGAALARDVLSLSVDQDARDMTAADITEMTLVERQGAAAVLVSLSEQAADWLARATLMNVGRPLTISACGTTILTPPVQEPITGGQLLMTGEMADLGPALIGLHNGSLGCTDLAEALPDAQ